MFRRSGTAVPLATTLVAAAAALALTASTAAAATAPGFLAGTELPPHASSPWYAGTVTKGLPESAPFCLEGVLPAAGSWHRVFGTEYDTGAVQVSVRSASPAAAAKLAGTLERKVAACAADWLRTTPGAPPPGRTTARSPSRRARTSTGSTPRSPTPSPGCTCTASGATATP